MSLAVFLMRVRILVAIQMCFGLHKICMTLEYLLWLAGWALNYLAFLQKLQLGLVYQLALSSLEFHRYQLHLLRNFFDPQICRW
ncbi:MAG: hypothetical protein EB059_06785 [Alphaproteobacteria bacterium]|nr:hypothetical protein [Alphaproteobacteria bacterium]